jgi:hypothetical protein
MHQIEAYFYRGGEICGLEQANVVPTDARQARSLRNRGHLFLKGGHQIAPDLNRRLRIVPVYGLNRRNSDAKGFNFEPLQKLTVRKGPDGVLVDCPDFETDLRSRDSSCLQEYAVETMLL